MLFYFGEEVMQWGKGIAAYLVLQIEDWERGEEKGDTTGTYRGLGIGISGGIHPKTSWVLMDVLVFPRNMISV